MTYINHLIECTPHDLDSTIASISSGMVTSVIPYEDEYGAQMFKIVVTRPEKVKTQVNIISPKVN